MISTLKKPPYLRQWYKAIALHIDGLRLDSVLPRPLCELSKKGKAFKVATDNVVDHGHCQLQAGGRASNGDTGGVSRLVCVDGWWANGQENL